MAHSTLTKRRKVYFFRRALYFINIRMMIALQHIKSFFSSIPIYYRTPRLLLTDSLLFMLYFGFSEYKIHRKYMEAINASNPDAYGDTPTTTMMKIAEIAGIKPVDSCLDLGCGTGRVGFTWHLLYGCSYTGLDINPIFIKRGKFLSRLLGLKTYFSCKDMRSLDARSYDVVYLYGSLYSDEFISHVYDKLLSLRKGAKVITVSYSLHTWDKGENFTLTDMFVAKFPWGSAQIFIQEKRDTAVE